MLSESLCEEVSPCLHEQDFKAEHIKALLEELDVEVLHLAAGEAAVHGCHVCLLCLIDLFVLISILNGPINIWPATLFYQF